MEKLTSIVEQPESDTQKKPIPNTGYLSIEDEVKRQKEQLLAKARNEQKEFEDATTGSNMLERISAGEIKKIEALLGSANDVKLLNFQEGGWGVFKAKAGEKPDLRANTIEAGTYYLREEAAFYIDQILGFNLVPPTSIREVQGDIGSIQQFVADSKSTAELTFKERDALVPLELFKLWIFDYIIWNSDRHFYNYIMRDGKVCAVDNGLSLNDQAPSRVALEYFNMPVPDEIKTRLAELEVYLDSKDEHGEPIADIIEKRLAASIGEEQAAKCIERMRLMARVVREKGAVAADFDGGAWKSSRLKDKNIVKKKAQK